MGYLYTNDHTRTTIPSERILMLARKPKEPQQVLLGEGFENVIQELMDLLEAYPPPFVFINDPITPRLSASILRSRLGQKHSAQKTNIFCACVDASSCFSPKILYDTIINSLASWVPDWADGCSNWAGPSDMQGSRDTGSFDGFISALHSIWDTLNECNVNVRRQTVADACETRLAIFVEHAERLKETMPDLMVPLTRLAELVSARTKQIEMNVHWELIRPPMGASFDPYYIIVPPISREGKWMYTLARLNAVYPPSLPTRLRGIDHDAYHPSLKPLYTLYITTLFGVCSTYTKDLDELAYIAAARWPGFVQPVLDEHKQRIAALRMEHRSHAVTEEVVEFEGDEDISLDDVDVANNFEEPAIECPDEHTRMRLAKLFTTSIQHALEHLYPRHTSALAWATANVPPGDLLSLPPLAVPPVVGHLPTDISSNASLQALPRMAKFVLVAAFLASTNPARTDVRMFGRGPDERKKRRRGGPRKSTAKSTAVKIPQRLIGPMPFALDRMFAILGALLEENDIDNHPTLEDEVPGEHTDMEISRVAVYAQVMELTSMHLLHRTSPADRLDMSPVFKCGIGYDAALDLAKELRVALNDLMWEPV
ncbi:hypothetical protein EIP86_003750 [Pleurotus ostreatoroseus]|nr:hypothetical protein EIP86_003750 [Pleurotus ostreatoroseus]